MTEEEREEWLDKVRDDPDMADEIPDELKTEEFYLEIVEWSPDLAVVNMDKLEEKDDPTRGFFIPKNMKIVGYDKEDGRPIVDFINDEDRKEWEKEMEFETALGQTLLENG